MRPKTVILICLFAVCLVAPVLSAEQISPYGGVLQNYSNTSGGVDIQARVNIPLTVEDVAYPDWLFAMILVFMIITICFGLVFISKDPAPWVNVIACGVLIFGLGLTAAMMAPLVAHIQTNTDIVVNVTGEKTVMIEQTVTYLLSAWVSLACYGIAIGGGLIFMIAGFLLQMKEAKRVADIEQAQKNADAENYMQGEKSIQWRKRDRL